MSCCRRLPPLVLAFLLFFVNLCPADSPRPDLAARIGAVLSRPEYKQSHWGLLVVDSQTGTTLFERDPDRLFLPASTTKLYSCAAAFLALGPDHRFETPVYRRGELKQGKLTGDLILVAQGDLTLGGRTDSQGRMAFTNADHTYASFLPRAELTATDPLAGLTSLAKQVAAAGVRHVTGEVLVDDRLFERSKGSGSGPDLVSPVLVNDNVVDVIITPAAKAGQPAVVRTRPETSYIRTDAEVATVAAGEGTSLDLESAGANAFTVRGRIAVNAKPVVRIAPVDDPSGFARALFIEALRREGVTVEASPIIAPRAELPQQSGYGGLTRVAVYTSPPFSELLKVTLKVSHNLYASTLPMLVAVKNGKRTLADGLKQQRRLLADLGVDTETISFAGGAGGASADAVTPRATVQLLRALAKRPDYPVFETALPILGVDGTLAESVAADSPARGKVHAKTGTLIWQDLLNDRGLLRSKALAGAMTTASGRSLTFAMFVNDVPLPAGVTSTREGKVLGHLCEILYKDGQEKPKVTGPAK